MRMQRKLFKYEPPRLVKRFALLPKLVYHPIDNARIRIWLEHYWSYEAALWNPDNFETDYRPRKLYLYLGPKVIPDYGRF
jgi:hypothetical protein